MLRSGGLTMSASDLGSSQEVFLGTTGDGSFLVSSSPEQATSGLPSVEGMASSALIAAQSFEVDAPSSQPQTQEPPSSQDSLASTQAFAQSQTSTVGYLANRNLAQSWSSSPSTLTPRADGPFKYVDSRSCLTYG